MGIPMLPLTYLVCDGNNDGNSPCHKWSYRQMALTVNDLKSIKPGKKTRKLTDGRGLYLLITPTGGKWWRFDYRFGGKRKTLSMGTYPDVSLKEARNRIDIARLQLTNKIDPADLRKVVEQPHDEEAFEFIAREWFFKNSPNWSASHSRKIIARLEQNVFPWIGTRPARDIAAPELLTVLRRIEARGALETAHRVLQNCGQVFRYAIATGRADRDPSHDLRGALSPWKPKHYPTITDPTAVGELLRIINDYHGGDVVRCALRLAPLLFVRPGELRRAEWSEVNIVNAEWRIPAKKMKARQHHIVPLSRQALEIFKELLPLTGDGQWVFPGIRTGREPMSENTVNAALRRMGFDKTTFTAHGFRSMASTLLHEEGWPSDVIERQLAHAERNSVKAAYNRASHLAERRKMMQWWADYLDKLRDGADVILLREHSKTAQRSFS